MSDPEQATVAPRRGRPPKITRQKLVEVALEIGLENLTLSEVARRLGVQIQSLYNHVRNRDDLFLITSLVLCEQFPLPPDEGRDWSEWVFEAGYVLKRTYEHAPGFATVMMARTAASAPLLAERWKNGVDIALRSGFGPVDALWVNLAVTEFVCAWVARRELLARNADAVLAEGEAPDRSTDYGRRFNRRMILEARGYQTAARFDVRFKALLRGLADLRDEGSKRSRRER